MRKSLIILTCIHLYCGNSSAMLSACTRHPRLGCANFSWDVLTTYAPVVATGCGILGFTAYQANKVNHQAQITWDNLQSKKFDDPERKKRIKDKSDKLKEKQFALRESYAFGAGVGSLASSLMKSKESPGLLSGFASLASGIAMSVLKSVGDLQVVINMAELEGSETCGE